MVTLRRDFTLISLILHHLKRKTILPLRNVKQEKKNQPKIRKRRRSLSQALVHQVALVLVLRKRKRRRKKRRNTRSRRRKKKLRKLKRQRKRRN
jgi:hypothetical protein